MIKTITAHTKEDFDDKVNAFEKEEIYKTGVSRVFATQTHVLRNEGMSTEYIAVIFYHGEVKNGN